MPYEAKTDWKYDDLVTEKDMNRLEQGLKDTHVPAYQPLTLNPGLQVVEVENDTPFRMGEVKGRTLVNLLGRAGGMESAANVLPYRTTLTINTENADTGTKSLKVTVVEGYDSGAGFYSNFTFVAGKYYVAIAMIKSLDTQKARLSMPAYGTGNIVTTTDKFAPSVLRVGSLGSNVVSNIDLWVAGEGKSAYFDSVRIYEITAAEYDAIAKMTPEQVAGKYPYVDGMTNVKNPYAIVTGGNLLTPFYYMGAVNGAIVDIKSDYDIDLTTNNTLQFMGMGNMEAQHKTYRLDFDSMGTNVKCYFNEQAEYDAIPIRQHEIDASGATIEIGDDTKYIGVFFGNMSATGSFKVKNPMLTPDSEPKPFVPQRRCMLAFETELAAHPVDGSNPDTLFMRDDGLPYVLEKWGKVTLEPSNFDNTTANDQPDGFKQFSIELKQKNTTNHVALIKFDGTQLTHDTISAPLVKPDSFNVGSGSHGGYVWMTIANSDSGWGKDYEPSQDEIKAYFLGWRMFEWGQWNNQPYNRTDGLEKAWVQIGETNYWSPEFTTRTVPTSMATAFDYTPYRLQYLKAKPTVEPVRNYELGATLLEGSNMVEVGSGIVIRENVNPPENTNPNLAGRREINYTQVPNSKLKYKTNIILNIFKNHTVDHQWLIGNGTPSVPVVDSYGLSRANLPGIYYDPAAVYHVTYTMLDPTLAAPFSGTVAANLRGTVSDLVQEMGDIGRRLSVVENQKAEKDALPPQWITPTLLNGWTLSSNGVFPARYYKDGVGIVHVNGIVTGGATETVVFRLPAGYRPKTTIRTPSIIMSGTNVFIAYLDVKSSGDVIAVFPIQSTHLTLQMSFLAEQ
ncbi:hypothetical protein QJQ58_29790 [Paenibacillus dendritiformis]|uniref:hypothetical protein n=1 Tax=Paenibacillus dendritiformis TaxID=130049 RepID=UPI00248C0A77|nr:hypothetical protein [Paenibacillus dendritiformis]WGU94626.1 hypothetical protein QJQ58_29790 [Paenibacillus dendritiformis]